MLGQVSIVTATQTDALLVPREAINGTPSPNGPATLVVLDGGRAQRTTVQLGLVSDRAIQVKSGLSDGQVVAIGNVSGLNNGDAGGPQLRTALAPPRVPE